MPVLNAFMISGKFRPKLFVLFHHKIKKHLRELTASNLAALVRIYCQIGSEYEYVFDLAEPVLQREITALGDDDLSNALIGYVNPNLQKNYAILYDLEQAVEVRAAYMDI